MFKQQSVQKNESSARGPNFYLAAAGFMFPVCPVQAMMVVFRKSEHFILDTYICPKKNRQLEGNCLVRKQDIMAAFCNRKSYIKQMGGELLYLFREIRVLQVRAPLLIFSR